ncbi:MAG: glycosyltransferase [Pseudomonadota bacterium]|nr:glycosyltransferase [Pseudomonadota bacterium]MDP2351054.1 glycosyltransferase [Pseudomonadota bacterium]
MEEVSDAIMSYSKKSDKSDDVLLIGPLPPPLGGATVSFANLVHTLVNRGITLTVVDTVKIRSALRLFITVFKHPARAVMLNASTPALVYVGLAISIACRMSGKRLVLRPFGGALANQYTTRNIAFRYIVRYLTLQHTMLLQTKSMVDFFANIVPTGNILWFPTSRTIQSTISTESEPTKFNKREKFRLLFMGQVTRNKGIDLFLALTKRFDSNKCEFVVAGPLMSDLSIDLIESQGAIYAGVIPHDKVQNFMSAFDVLVFPTFYEGEGYPGIVLEAFSAGIPVIASDWMHIPELVQDNINGFLFPPKDFEKLNDLVAQLVKDPAMQNRLRAGAQASAHYFSSEKWNGDFILECLGVNQKTAMNNIEI